MFLTHDGDRCTGVAKFDGFFNLGSISAVQPLVITNSTYHQVVDLLTYAGANLPATGDDQRFAVLARTIGHNAGEDEQPTIPLQFWDRPAERQISG